MNLDSQLTQLESQEIVRRLADADLAYHFKHALTQETVYASLLKKTRRDIHAQVAQTFEREYPDRLDEFAALLAAHYAEAGDDAKTIEYATRAGDANARVYANAEAVAHYSSAMDAAKRAGVPLGDLGVKRGRALELLGRYQDALANYAEMEMVAHERKDRTLELASLVARATLFSTHTPLHDGKRGEEFSERALGVARQIGDRLAEARILWTQMLFHIYGSGDGQKAVELGERSLSIMRELTAPPGPAPTRAVREQLAYTLNDMLYAYSQVSQLERGLPLRLEARDLWRELDNKPMLADNLAGVSIAQWSFGDAAAGLASADEGYAVAESVDNAWSMAQGRAMRGYALAELGRFGEAFAALHESDRFATAVETGGAMIAARCGLASNYVALGIFDPGLENAQRALEGALRYIPDWHLWPQSILIRFYLAHGDLPAAQRIADESQITSRERKLFKAFMPGVAAVVLADAELALAKKDYARALTITEEAFEYFKGSCPNYLPDLYLLRANAFLGRGERDDAAQTLQLARSATEKARRIRWQVLGTASEVERARGNEREAERLREEARLEMEFIAQNLTDEMRGAFLNLPLVQRVMN